MFISSSNKAATSQGLMGEGLLLLKMVEDKTTGFQPSGIGIPHDFLDGSSHEDFLFPIPKSDGHISMYIQIGMVYTAIDVVHAFIDVL